MEIISDKRKREKEALSELKSLLKEMKNLRCPTDDDEFLLRFIRVRKYNPEEALIGIRQYYTLRDNSPGLTEILFPSALKHVFDCNIVTVLKHSDCSGKRIMFWQSRNWDPVAIDLRFVLAATFLVIDEITSTEDVQLSGLIAIIDHGGLTFTKMRQMAGQMTFARLHRIIYGYQGGMPAKFKSAHIVNNPYIFDLIYALAKPFLKEKLKRRILEHGKNVQNIHQHLNPEILPKSLGGHLPNEEAVDHDFMQRIMAKNDFYKEMATYGFVHD
ncbi:unnamed protein product [Orchesella dallaii]